MHEVSPRPIHVIWLYLTRCNQGMQTLAPWKACWPDEHNQIELSILNNRSGFNPLQRSLQAPINAQISFGLGRNLAFGLLSSSWNACCMAPFMRSGGPFLGNNQLSARCKEFSWAFKWHVTTQTPPCTAKGASKSPAFTAHRSIEVRGTDWHVNLAPTDSPHRSTA